MVTQIVPKQKIQRVRAPGALSSLLLAAICC